MARRKLSIISLFSGALGLDLGLERAGFEIRVAVECNKYAAATIRHNRPDIPVIERRIESVTTQEILDAAGLDRGEPFIVTAGPSCQAFSTVGQRGSMGDPRGVMFREFLRVVRESEPEFFVMENVKGVLSAAIKHRPLGERGASYPPLSAEEELGSAFRLILTELQWTNYHVVFDVLNAADFAAAQLRERVLFIGSRDGRRVTMPSPTHERRPSNGQMKWVTLRDALRGLRDPNPAFVELAKSKKKYLKLIPQGGNWRDLPPKLQREAMGKAYDSWGGRIGFCRRLSWREPAPSLTTKPDGRATMLCHPTELRPLSVREYARLQQYPDEWEFCGGIPQQYRQMGNAVPLCIGEGVGRSIRKARRRKARQELLGTIVCDDEALLNRLANRPKTILNPIRMRAVKDAQASKEWLTTCGGGRRELYSLVGLESPGADLRAGRGSKSGKKRNKSR
jgi:DNA (cytosine-5)-methyltransferase 1